MKKVKEKMYSYEVTPPSGIWQGISFALDRPGTEKAPALQQMNNRFYFGIAAAASIILIFTAVIRLTVPAKQIKEVAAAEAPKFRSPGSEDQITVPQPINTENSSANTSPNGNTAGIVAKPANKYLIISGPEGQPVKISPKVFSLIVSSDHQDPPNPVWDEKVKKWKDIMKANILGPATANFLDIVDLTRAVNDQ